MEIGLAERRLICNAQNGCEKSYNLLIEKYKKTIDRTARRYFIKGADSDDVLQECYIGFCKAIRDYKLDHETNFYPFLSTCINRHIFSKIKDSYSNKNKLMNDIDNDELIDVKAICNSDSDPLEIYILNEKLLIINRVLNYELSKVEKKSLSYLLSDYSYKDISKVLRIDVKKVNNAIYRARKKLNLSPRNN